MSFMSLTDNNINKVMNYIINLPDDIKNQDNFKKMLEYLEKGYNSFEIYTAIQENLTDDQFTMLTTILDTFPHINKTQTSGVYSFGQIIKSMDNPSNFYKLIKYINEGFDNTDILNIINLSDEKISIMYNLISHGIEKDTAADVVSQPKDQDMLTLLSFINEHHVSSEDIGMVANNFFDGMLQRIKILLERGIEFMTAYEMVDANEDTIENI